MQKHSLHKQCKKVFIVLLLLLSHSLLIYAGGIYAGADRAVCLNGSTSIGLSSSNSNLCFKWSGTGINGSNDQSPTISKLTTSQVYSVTVTNKDGNIVAQEQVTVFVFDLTVVVNKPRVLGSGSFTSNDEAMTFENIDNDDNDFMFDFKDTDGVLGGDDELFEIATSIKWFGTTPTTKFPMNIAALKGGADIDIWEKNDKTNHLQFNTPIIPTSVSSFSFWVEGLKAHSVAKSTELSINLHNNTGSCKRNVSITIVGIQSMIWEGYGNGDESLTNNVLGNSPNTNNQIVFPDARFEGTSVGAKRDKVKLKILLTCLPPTNFNMYMRALDIDDPTAGTRTSNSIAGGSSKSINADTQNLLDPNDSGSGSGTYSGTTVSYDSENDNRGSFPVIVGGKYGRWNSPLSPDNSLSMVSFAANQSEASNDFYVSQHPGDNYQVGAYPDLDFVSGFIEIDEIHSRIRYKNMSGGLGLSYIDGRYTSNKLEVWRLLHLEFDEMVAFGANDPHQNLFDEIKGFSNSTIATPECFATSVSSILTNNLKAYTDVSGISVVDKSPVVNANGRFENGEIYIGRDPITGFSAVNSIFLGPLGTVTSPILRNTATALTFKLNQSIVPLRAVISYISAAGVPISQNCTVAEIKQINIADFEISLTGIVVSAAFIGRRISIGGGSEINIDNAIVLGNKIRILSLSIPFKLRDDDSPSTLIHALIPNTSRLSDAFKEAFVKIVQDGGGIPTNSNSNVPFIPNLGTDFTDIPSLTTQLNHISLENQSLGNEKDNFWITYFLNAWQGEFKEDGDGNTESPTGYTLGLTVSLPPFNYSDIALSTGANLSYFVSETFNDVQTLVGGADINRTMAHEIGHQFGFEHGTVIPESNTMGLMGSGQALVNNAQNINLFIPRNLNLIRSRVKSPGK